MERLSKLQRLGISFLLFQYAKHDSRLIRNGGIIRFVNNEMALVTNMFVKLNGVKETIISLTLSNTERINDKVEYRFEWDNYNQIFTIEERGYSS